MARLPRTTVIFTVPQWQWLHAEAERLGLSVGEFIRRIIDAEREA